MSRRSAETGLLLDRAAFIRSNLHVTTVSFHPGMRLYLAHAASGLRRRVAAAGRPPYWAYVWAGGALLVRHILAQPEIVVGRRVLDLGAGSGLVAIAAALAGASTVIASEIDPDGIAAIGLNAVLNHVAVDARSGDLLRGRPPAVDVVLVGDLFYDVSLARQVIPFLDRCLDAGIEVLVGDPGRKPLPLDRLRLLAEYATADFGGASMATGSVFAFARVD